MFKKIWKITAALVFVSQFGTLNLMSAEKNLVQIEKEFVELSPDRSLVIADDSRAIWHLRDSVKQGKQPSEVAFEKVEKRGGWKTTVELPKNFQTFDNFKLEIHTNNRERANHDAGAIVEALGFLPVDRLSWDFQEGKVRCKLLFFDDFVFLLDTPFGGATLFRKIAPGRCFFVSQTPVTYGDVERYSLVGGDVFFFVEDHERTLQSERTSSPTAKYGVFWDDQGKYRGVARYDDFEVTNAGIMLETNVSALRAGCGRDSSAICCNTSRNASQLSLLDPCADRLLVLRSVVHIEYEKGALGPVRAQLSVVPLKDFHGHTLSCEPFRSVDELLDSKDTFGPCGVNIDSVREFRCLGTPGGYLKESRVASISFWNDLKKNLGGCDSSRIAIGSGLAQVLAKLPKIDTQSFWSKEPAQSFGYRGELEYRKVCEDVSRDDH